MELDQEVVQAQEYNVNLKAGDLNFDRSLYEPGVIQ
jgi:hypothetical protein